MAALLIGNDQSKLFHDCSPLPPPPLPPFHLPPPPFPPLPHPSPFPSSPSFPPPLTLPSLSSPPPLPSPPSPPSPSSPLLSSPYPSQQQGGAMGGAGGEHSFLFHQSMMNSQASQVNEPLHTVQSQSTYIRIFLCAISSCYCPFLLSGLLSLPYPHPAGGHCITTTDSKPAVHVTTISAPLSD